MKLQLSEFFNNRIRKIKTNSPKIIQKQIYANEKVYTIIKCTWEKQPIMKVFSMLPVIFQSFHQSLLFYRCPHLTDTMDCCGCCRKHRKELLQVLLR